MVECLALCCVLKKQCEMGNENENWEKGGEMIEMMELQPCDVVCCGCDVCGHEGWLDAADKLE